MYKNLRRFVSFLLPPKYFFLPFDVYSRSNYRVLGIREGNDIKEIECIEINIF